jgi:DNA-3-methyladenine glycosylase
MKRLDLDFYLQDALVVAPALLGKLLVRKTKKGKIIKLRITETEIYRGEEDTACHARFGKTKRNAPLYMRGGYTYVYLCYGIHYLFNVVTGKENEPQAVLIRGVEGFAGPGKLTKAMEIDKSINKVNLTTSKDIWIEDDGFKANYETSKRIGIDYATEPYKSIEWRFVIKK